MFKYAKPKLINCKVCGSEMSDCAKTCPKCGQPNKIPFYKKHANDSVGIKVAKLFLRLLQLLILFIIGVFLYAVIK
jgi:hypothetical protein